MSAIVSRQQIDHVQRPSEVVVRELLPQDVPQWDRFVQSCMEASFFHRVSWKRILEEVFGHRTIYLLAEESGQIQGVLALAEIKSWLFGHSLCSLPFCVYGGVATNSDRAREALDREAQRISRLLRVDYLEYRCLKGTHPDWTGKPLYVTFRGSLQADDEANMLAIPRKQRAMVRKGIKAGLTAEVDTDTRRFYSLYSSNVHRHGTPALPRKFFDALVHYFRDDCEILTVVDPKVGPVSSVLSFYFRDEVLPYYAGDRPEARDVAANDFKYWSLMRQARSRGCRTFDFGRSKIGTGSYDFKRNWGFEPIPLMYEYQLHTIDKFPEKNPLNPKYRFFINMWRRLPLPMATFFGPSIVKYLG